MCVSALLYPHPFALGGPGTSDTLIAMSRSWFLNLTPVPRSQFLHIILHCKIESELLGVLVDYRSWKNDILLNQKIKGIQRTMGSIKRM